MEANTINHWPSPDAIDSSGAALAAICPSLCHKRLPVKSIIASGAYSPILPRLQTWVLSILARCFILISIVKMLILKLK